MKSTTDLFRKALETGVRPEKDSVVFDIFRYQAKHNLIYNNYCNALKIAPDKIENLEKIPFLPIEFFKKHQVRCGDFLPEVVFTSSGTTGEFVSRHEVRSIANYEASFISCFHKFYGDPSEWVILGLLPSYLERNGSSLIYMVEKLIKLSGNKDSGLFLYDHDKLKDILIRNESAGKKCLLIGVTFALLDFARNHSLELKNTVIMETGGMKGRGEELTRQEVSEILRNSFGQLTIHSEYGMTELLSQAYSKHSGLFESPSWMKILVRDTSDPLTVNEFGSGAINVIDLANVDSCSFIATMDLGKVHENGQFEVLGRMDHSDVRGCNLLIL